MDRNKNVMAGFLMVLGVIFVLIAGGVFVTTAWSYLPEPVKQFLLMVLTIVFFGAAYWLKKHDKLPKTELALYYLGVAFCGYCSISCLGGIHFALQDRTDAGRLLAASLVMLLPVAYRLVSEHLRMGQGMGFHMMVMLILTDSILVWGFIYSGLEDWMQPIVAAGILLAYALADCFGKSFLHRYQEVKIIFYLAFCFHAFVYFCIWLSGLGNRHPEGERLALAALLCLTAYILWKSWKNILWRILHSLTLLWLVYMVVMNLHVWGIYTFSPDAGTGEGMVLITYAFCVLLMLVMQRSEMIWILMRFAPAMALLQLLEDALCNEGYLPYSLLCMVGLILLPLVKEWKNAGEREAVFFWRREGLSVLRNIYWKGEEGRRFLIAAFLQACSAVILFCLFHEQSREMELTAFWVLLCIMILNSALLSGYDIWRRILYTLALFPGVFACWVCPWINIPFSFIVEYFCFCAELAVVLLGCIWYDKEKENVRLIQFVLNCVLLGILLFWNLCGGSLENALVLGGISMFLIVGGGYFHRRNYMMAGMVSLFFLVVYATRGLWLNIAWWVYLLAAGVVLIVLASHALSKSDHKEL